MCLFWDMPVLVARAPTRIDFGGGWTDVPPYPDEEGGFVCNVAITRYSTVHLTGGGARSRPLHDAVQPQMAHAALRAARLQDVHAAIHDDFPLGAGLGGSSAAGVALMTAIEAWRAMRAGEGSHVTPGSLPLDRAALAEASRRLEVEELRIAGGRQDHYAAAFGGALALTFGAATSVRPLPLAPSTIQALEARCLVVYTGQSRVSGGTITAVLDAYRARDTGVLHALAHMKALAMSMADALAAGDVDSLGTLVGEHWRHQRALHPAISTPLIDRILQAASSAGAIGGKALGASGGGCVLVIAPRGGEHAVREAVQGLATPLPFSIDLGGASWWTQAAADAATRPPSFSKPST